MNTWILDIQFTRFCSTYVHVNCDKHVCHIWLLTSTVDTLGGILFMSKWKLMQEMLKH